MTTTQTSTNGTVVLDAAPAMMQATIATTEGVAIGTLSGVLKTGATSFSTGSHGYHMAGKLVIAGKIYQCGINLIEVGSKGTY
jgi:hypothetical protein